MSILRLPSEILEQVLTQTVQQDDFMKLRFVHSCFEYTIHNAAELLTKSLLQAKGLPVRILTYHQLRSDLNQPETARSKLFMFIRLHEDVRRCTRLDAMLNQHRDLFVGFPVWANVPAKGFSNIEPLLAFSALHYQLTRSVENREIDKVGAKIAYVGADKTDLKWRTLDPKFAGFVKSQLTMTDLESLMTIINFCAISTRFSNKMLRVKCSFSGLDAPGQRQDKQLESRLLVEQILCNGPSWLFRMLHPKALSKAALPTHNGTGLLQPNEEHVLWMGSRGEAARLTENGLAFYLWKERADRLELEGRTDGLETSDPFLWRGAVGANQ